MHLWSLLSDACDVALAWLLLPDTLRQLLRGRDQVLSITQSLRALRLPAAINDPFIGPELPPRFKFPADSDRGGAG